jgi:hypothetical protein
MTTPPTLPLNPEFGPMLFADCPFCLSPLPLDAVTGTMECRDCRIILELAAEPSPRVELAPAA